MSIKLLSGKGLHAPRVLSIYLKPGLLMVVFNSYREARSSSRHSSKKTHPNQRLLTLLDNFDWFGFSLDDVKWFKDRGCRLIKVDAAPGVLIIWDSRTVHYASLPKSETIRTIIYATYTPARLATPESLALKSELLHKYEAMTHWPHCNIFGQGRAMRNGRLCPGERDEPLEKAVLTEIAQAGRSQALLKLNFCLMELVHITRCLHCHSLPRTVLQPEIYTQFSKCFGKRLESTDVT
jgi:hypothetical protein